MIKKLVRIETVKLFREGEAETITDQEELNKLYALKIKEELAEIQHSDHKDIMEFVDLIEVAYSFARSNGFYPDQIEEARRTKIVKKGTFSNIALNNLNPNNPSNEIYFRNHLKQTIPEPKQHLNNHINFLHQGIFYSPKELEVLQTEAFINAIKELQMFIKNNET